MTVHELYKLLHHYWLHGEGNTPVYFRHGQMSFPILETSVDKLTGNTIIALKSVKELEMLPKTPSQETGG